VQEREAAMAGKGQANSRLAVERRRRGWSQDDLVDRMCHVARINTLPAPRGLNVNYISRWERGVNQPDRHHEHLLCLSFELPPDRLGLPDDSTYRGRMTGDEPPPGGVGEADRYDVREGGIDTDRREALKKGLVLGAAALLSDPFFAALERVSPLGGLSIGATVDGLEEMVADFGWSLTREPVERMYVRVNGLLTTTQDMLDSEPASSYERRLQSVAGRCACLLSATLIDLADHGAAKANAILGHQYGALAPDTWLQGFAWLQRARIAEDGGRYEESVRLAREGLAVAPERTAAVARLLCSEAQGFAELGRDGDALAAIAKLRSLFDRLPAGEVGESAVGFTAPRLDRVIGQVLLCQGAFDDAERHIRAAIPSFVAAGTHSSTASTQLELSQILVGRGRPDEAMHVANQALDTDRLVANHLQRAARVELALAERYPDLPETRDFRERRAALALPAPPAQGAGRDRARDELPSVRPSRTEHLIRSSWR
jgi:tetratricopeptide (TPR) repeat protein